MSSIFQPRMGKIRRTLSSWRNAVTLFVVHVSKNIIGPWLRFSTCMKSWSVRNLIVMCSRRWPMWRRLWIMTVSKSSRDLSGTPWSPEIRISYTVPSQIVTQFSTKKSMPTKRSQTNLPVQSVNRIRAICVNKSIYQKNCMIAKSVRILHNCSMMPSMAELCITSVLSATASWRRTAAVPWWSARCVTINGVGFVGLRPRIGSIPYRVARVPSSASSSTVLLLDLKRKFTGYSGWF